MTLAFDSLPQPLSLLSRLDPRWKLAALTLAILCVALLHTVPAAGFALVGALVLAALGGLPFRWFLDRLGGLALFLLVLVVLLPVLLHNGGPHLQLGPLEVSWYGLRVASLLSLKAIAIVTLVLVGLATSPLGATLQAAHQLHVPGLLVQLAMLSYRYIFVLGDELSRLRIALRVRGFRSRVSRHSYRTVGHVAGILLVRGYERAERVGQAMRCRGFDGQFRSLTEFRSTLADVLFFFLVSAGATALLVIDYFR